jgi:hypothetical protein
LGATEAQDRAAEVARLLAHAEEAIMRAAILILSGVLTLVGTPGATTYLVTADGTGDFPTIQAAINAAAEGDTVSLAPGTFRGEGNRDLNYLGKSVVVRSQNGDPDDCTLDCEGSLAHPRRGFYFHSGESPQAVLEGVTIRWGFAQYGGGIRCINGSSPTICNCRIRDCSGSYQTFGAGMYCDQSSPTITGCEFIGNLGEFGGGLYCRISSSTVSQCLFVTNEASQRGAGICCYEQAEILVTMCTFSSNSGLRGAGFYASESSPTP